MDDEPLIEQAVREPIDPHGSDVLPILRERADMKF